MFELHSNKNLVASIVSLCIGIYAIYVSANQKTIFYKTKQFGLSFLPTVSDIPEKRWKGVLLYLIVGIGFIIGAIAFFYKYEYGV